MIKKILNILAVVVIVSFVGVAGYFLSLNLRDKKQNRSYYQQYRKIKIEKLNQDRSGGKIDSYRFNKEMNKLNRQDEIIADPVPGKAHRKDLCRTCHRGGTDTSMTDQKAPFKTHPGDYLQVHPPETVGCTVCHEGDGTKLNRDWAHGRKTPEREGEKASSPQAEFSSGSPILTGEYVQSSCTKCHNPDSISLMVPNLMKGKELVKSLGCRDCHTVEGAGGIEGPDLSYMGDKPYHDYNYSRLSGSMTAINWHREHLKDPAKVSPGTTMPQIPLDDDKIKNITIYLLSLRGEKIDKKDLVLNNSPDFKQEHKLEPPIPQEGPAYGKMIYEKLDCSKCHYLDGTGDSKGVDLSLEGELNRSDGWLKRVIRSHKEVFYGNGLPEDYKLDEKDESALIEYLQSLK